MTDPTVASVARRAADDRLDAQCVVCRAAAERRGKQAARERLQDVLALLDRMAEEGTA